MSELAIDRDVRRVVACAPASSIPYPVNYAMAVMVYPVRS